MVRRLILAALLACSTSTAALAGIYVGAAAGQATLNRDEFNTEFNGSDTSYKLYGGVRFLKFLGFEAAYADMGTPDDSSAGLQFKSDVRAWDAFAVGVLPLGGHFELFAKAGVVYWKTDSTITGGSMPTFTDDDSGADAAYGAGAAFKFAKLFAIRAEYEEFEIGGGQNLHMATLGFDVRF